jgi:glycosyltransferase involved in cell wall biosynthesis
VRILHVCSEYPPQKVFGLGRYVSGLSRGLAAHGHMVHVLTNSLGGMDQDVVDHGVHVHRTAFPPPPMPPTPGAPVAAFNVHLQQRAFAVGRNGVGDPEVVVSHDWLTAVAGHRIARRWGLPHVWTVHDTVHGKRFGRIDQEEDRLAYSIEKWAMRTSNLVLVNSNAVARECVEVYGLDRSKIELLHPGIDPDTCQSDQSSPRLKAFRSLLARPEETLLTFAGRLDLEKGIDTLINGFAHLRSTAPNVRLAIAGRGVLLPTITAHLRNLQLEDAVTMMGYVQGQMLWSLYKVSDIHVCPSYYEPFGLVALEAMAAGTPVVVSDTGGLLDIVTSSEVGRTFQSRNSESLSFTLFELVGNPYLRRRIGQTGREHVFGKFAWSTLAQTASSLYGKAICSTGAAVAV